MLALAVVVTRGWPIAQSSAAQPQHESPFFQKLKKYLLADVAARDMVIRRSTAHVLDETVSHCLLFI